MTARTGAAAFAAEMERLDLDAEMRAALDHWHAEIAEGRVSVGEARKVPAQAVAARDRLLAHLREVEKDDGVGAGHVYERYSRVFKSRNIPGVTEVIVEMKRFGLVQGMSIVPDVDRVERFLERFPPEEVLRRFDKLQAWMVKYHKTNHDGNILTPVLLDYLSDSGDFDSKLGELDRLKAETRQGRFRTSDVLQRDLEFRRFVYEYTRFLEPLTYVLRGRYPQPMSDEEMYGLFIELKELPPQVEEEFALSDEQVAEAGRAAYEAAGFLNMLREFRANTTRHIVVLGNDRFGRQWVVEPIEEYLRDGFSVRYDRVRSGTSTRLAVPMVFPRAFVEEITERMPHIVIVDGSHAPADLNVMQLSRAVRDYANWFAVFNDTRSEGDGSRYKHESSLPLGHFPELEKWHEYTRAKEQLVEWVTPGPTYRVTSWAPELKDEVMMGDERLSRHHEELGGDRPLVVLANAIVYRTQGDDLPDALRGTTPRYFDDPDHHVADTVVFGFGSHGLETRRKGAGTERFVSTVQRHIKEEIARLQSDPPTPSGG